MRTPNLPSRDRLLQTLRTTPRRSSTELSFELGISVQSVRRLLDELPENMVLKAGQTRRARYALRRPLRGTMENLALYSIDEAGQAHSAGQLALVQPQGTLLPLEKTAWPVPAESRDGWWGGLPYPIFAVRPNGYMGRRFARAEYLTLGVSEDPEEWSDDDILWALSQRGSDVVGNLLLGNPAYELWLKNKIQGQKPLPNATLPAAYAQFAGQAVAVAGGGSSAACEFPKFAAIRELDGALTPHVLVKFSGASGSAAEQRWGDLLVCEHLALECVRQLEGINAARSRILSHEGRVFIEVERFDRVGHHGRISLCGLDAIQPTFLGGRATEWPEVIGRLHHMGHVDVASVANVERLWWFGRLIANTDMHLGNLSFHAEHTLRLAPVYDMLPMTFAPLAGGEVPPRNFVPALPLPPQREVWLTACAVAISFWTAAATDTRISEAFRAICRANAERLRDLAAQV